LGDIKVIPQANAVLQAIETHLKDGRQWKCVSIYMPTGLERIQYKSIA
jgi:hypothetical protein